ncbi:hypothetical protein WDH52_03140 [Streptomyces sp. TRM70308]|uniref:hypothetical protein n=1 Tax=Streptomyces sp. TRM70308 TaxID=3131932 RepID=UPI003CFCDC5C
MEHAHDLVAVGDLPVALRPHGLVPYRAAPPCDFVRICQRCGETDGEVVTEHDWDNSSWGGRCRRCGQRWVDDGD